MLYLGISAQQMGLFARNQTSINSGGYHGVHNNVYSDGMARFASYYRHLAKPERFGVGQFHLYL